MSTISKKRTEQGCNDWISRRAGDWAELFLLPLDQYGELLVQKMNDSVGK